VGLTVSPSYIFNSSVDNPIRLIEGLVGQALTSLLSPHNHSLMARPKTSLQLWSLRDRFREDFAATVQAVAELGFTGVETAGYGNLNAADAAKAIKAAGLEISGMHVGIDRLRNEFNAVVDEAMLCETRDIICPFWPKAQFRSAAACRTIASDLARIGERLAGLGFRFHYHNHGFDMNLVEGRPSIDWMMDATAPAHLGFEADVYWVKVGGLDPAQLIHEYGRRIRLLHIKDEKEIGSGPVDFEAVFAAADRVGVVEWYVIEVEKYSYEPLESVRRSLEQMKVWGRA